MAALIRAVDDDDYHVRMHAGWALADAPGALPRAVALARDVSSKRKVAGLRALAAIGKKAGVVASVAVDATRDPDRDVRLAAARAVAACCHDATAVAALRPMFEDECDYVRSEALGFVRKMTKETFSVEEIVRIMGKRAEYARLEGTSERASNTERAEAHRGLAVVSARDPRYEIRIWALKQLASIATRYPPAMATLCSGLGDAEPYVRRSTAAMLQRLGSEAAPAVPALTKALENRETARFAAEALGAIGPAAHPTIPTLLGVLLNNEDAAYHVEDVIVKMGDVALPAILSRLRGGDRASRDPLIRLLAEMGPNADDAVIAFLGDADPRARAETAHLLGSHPRIARKASGILTGLVDDEFVVVRILAVFAWRALPASESVPALRKALHDPSGIVRHVAATALARIGPEAAAAAPRLAVLARSDHGYVRYRALRALAALGPDARAVLPVLRAFRS